MRVRPSVVFGLGSSGAYAISNIERLLYEVVGSSGLDFLKLIAIDTDTTRKEDEPPPGGHRRQNLPIYEGNLARVMQSLRGCLGDSFNWCGSSDIHIPGAGAGNLRGGGRLMLFNRLPDLWQTIQTANHEVEQAAGRPQTEAQLRNELSRRGIPAPSGLIEASDPVDYVIGTLAGGTCSGSCIDFGYMIHDAAPRSRRVGIFFIPDQSAPVVFQENTWSALKDLEYFCQNPNAFRNAVWPEANRTRRPYSGGPAAPYDLVYLISQTDEQRVLQLRYEPNAGSPLIVMGALKVTADLLGLFEHRDGVLCNLNAQVPGEPKHHMFLNFNLRAVCYPKYEISEAAACQAISENVCGTWLSDSVHDSQTGPSQIREEEWRAAGRGFWNDHFDPVWRGAQSAVDLADWTRRLLAGDIPEPEPNLRHQFGGNVQGTIYSQVAQQLPNRLRELQTMVSQGLAERLSQTRNIRCAELFLKGFRQEISYAQEYWTRLDIPPKQDDPAWLSHVTGLIESLLHGKSATSVLLLNARRDYVRDELQNILNQLEMYLLRRTLADFNDWMDREIADWLAQLRRTVEAVRNFARNRRIAVTNLLNSGSAPVLRLSRSARLGFEDEIPDLAARPPETQINYLRVSAGGQMEGLFAVKTGQDAATDEALFLNLKSLLQPEYLRRLEEKGAVDIVQEVMAQNRVAQAVTAARHCYALSVATPLSLVKDSRAVPSFVCARDTPTAQRLQDALRAENPGLPQLLPKPLPVFDHMAIFYQEGARLEPDLLTDAESFRGHYERAMADPNRRIELLDPLAPVRSASDAAKPAIAGGPK